MKPELKNGRRMNGGISNSGNSRRQHRNLLLLLLALGAALLSVALLHKLREGRIHGLLLRNRDRQVIALQIVLQREREKSREMKRKLEDWRAKIFVLRTQKKEISDKLTESQAMVDRLQKTKNEMETTFEAKQNEINRLSEERELVKQKEAKAEEMEQQLMSLSPREDNATVKDENEIMEKLPNMGEITEVDNANNDKQQNGTPNDGKWVEFKTNVDHEGLKAEAEVSDVQQKHNLTNSLENEKSGGGEMSWVSTSENLEQNEELHNDEGKINEMSQARTMEIKEQSQELINDKTKADGAEERVKEDAADGNKSEVIEQNRELESGKGNISVMETEGQPKDKEQERVDKQIATEETKTVAEGKETKIRVGHRNKKRTRRRRRPTSRGRELERKSDRDMGKAQKDENLGDENNNSINITAGGHTHGEHNETVSKTTIPYDTAVDDGQSNSGGKSKDKEERPVDTNQQLQNAQNLEGDENAKDNEGDNNEHHETISRITVPNDTPSDEGLKTKAQTNSDIWTEGTERPNGTNQQLRNTQIQEVAEGTEVVEDSEGDGGSHSEPVTNTNGPVDENLKTDEEGNSESKAEARQETPDVTSQQLLNTQNQEGGESANDAERGGLNRITGEEDGNDDVTKNIGSEEMDGDAGDSIQQKETDTETQGEIQEEEEAENTSNLEQTEVQNNSEDHISQKSGNKVDIAEDSSPGKLKQQEETELTENTEDQNSED